MNFIPSLLLYNALEGLLFLYACHRFNKHRFGTKFDFKGNIVRAYLLGAISLPFQYLPYLFNSPAYQFATNIIVGFVVMPLILYLFTKKKYCFIVIIMYNLSIYASLDFLISFYNIGVLAYFGNKFGFEFVINITLKAIQFFLVIIGGVVYEKIYLKSRKNC